MFAWFQSSRRIRGVGCGLSSTASSPGISGCLFVCDMDSVITDAKLNDCPDLMEEFMRDGCGDALGPQKNEADDHLKDCGWAKDDMKRIKEEEIGLFQFAALFLGGCKFNCLRKEG